MSPTDKVLDKLAKLKAAREGEAALGNSAAAEAFAGTINRLLLQHELSEADIPMQGKVDEPIIEKVVDLKAGGIAFKRSRVGWQERLAWIVGEAHLCKYLVTTGTNYITFVGTRQHVAVAEYAYVVLVRAADEMSRRARDVYWREHRHEEDFDSGNFRAAWLGGFISRISERFADARRQEVRAAANSSTALIRLDQALARAAAHVDEKYKRKAAPTSMATGCLEGRQAGRRAADAMNIGQKGVGASGMQKKLGGGQ